MAAGELMGRRNEGNRVALCSWRKNKVGRKKKEHMARPTRGVCACPGSTRVAYRHPAFPA
jgi:hypothetical protein